MKTTLITFACIAGLAVAAAEAGQAGTAAKADGTQIDSRLEGWLGCWRLEDDLAGTGARLCITPEKHGVRLQTIAGTQSGTSEVVIPDGVARPIVDAECQGTERSEWSRNGRRVFRTTEVTCKNETPRTIKGIAFLSSGPSLINVQHVSGEGAANVRVQRYRRAANQTLADGTRLARPANGDAIDPTWTIEDVIEASQKLPAEALQGALADVRQKFNVTRKTLVAMDDAGVPDSVIDLMVALTFPERFVVERVTSSAPVGISTGMGWYDPFMSPLMSGAYGYSNCYMAGGYYGYRSYYNMCGPYLYGYSYMPYNYYRGDNYYYPGGWVPINNNPDNGGEVAASGHGRVVNGRGYTQIRERTPEPSVPRVSSRGDGSASGWSGGASAASSGGGVSSSGYSSGSSSGSSGGSSSGSSGGGDRVAVPRPGGGGR